MTHATTEPDTVWLRGEGGAVFRMALPLHPDYAKQLQKGLLKQVNEDGTPYTADDAVPALPTERPADDADKATWVGWAVVNGCTVDDAEALTTDDLIDLYGGGKHAVAVPTPEPTAEPSGGKSTSK